jgi:hypothetical protein
MWIEVFKAGSHTDSLGKTNDFTAEDLESIVAKYSARLAEEPQALAPLVKGHPRTNDEAIGWVERLARRGNFLLAKITNLTEEAATDIREKKFKNVSISLYPDFTLNHIGLLGAASPAVSGLKPVEFVAGFSDSSDFTDEHEEEQEESEIGEFRENLTLSEENARLRQQLNDYAEQETAREYEEFAESLVAGQKIAKSGKENLKRTLHYLHTVDKETESQFGLVEQFKSFITKLSGGVQLKEFATKDAAGGNAVTNTFSGRKVNPERSELHSKILRKMNENPEWSYEEALLSIEN